MRYWMHVAAMLVVLTGVNSHITFLCSSTSNKQPDTLTVWMGTYHRTPSNQALKPGGTISIKAPTGAVSTSAFGDFCGVASPPDAEGLDVSQLATSLKTNCMGATEIDPKTNQTLRALFDDSTVVCYDSGNEPHHARALSGTETPRACVEAALQNPNAPTPTLRTWYAVILESDRSGSFEIWTEGDVDNDLKGGGLDNHNWSGDDQNHPCGLNQTNHWVVDINVATGSAARCLDTPSSMITQNVVPESLSQCDGSSRTISAGTLCNAECIPGYRTVGQILCTVTDSVKHTAAWSTDFECVPESSTCSPPSSGAASEPDVHKDIVGVAAPCTRFTGLDEQCNYYCAGTSSPSPGLIKCIRNPTTHRNEWVPGTGYTGCEFTDTPATPVPLTPAPQTAVPDTDVPDTAVPQTPAPDTAIPATGVPRTAVPKTDVPQTDVPDTSVPRTGVPVTGIPVTGVPKTGVPITGTPVTGVPKTGIPQTDVPQTSVPQTSAPRTSAPQPQQTAVPKTLAPQTVPQTSAPSSVTTPAPGTKPDETPTPGTKPGETPAPGTTPSTTPAPGTTPATTPAPDTKPGTTPVPGTKPGKTPAPDAKPDTTPAPGTKPGETPAPDTQPGTTPVPGETSAPGMQVMTPTPGSWPVCSSFVCASIGLVNKPDAQTIVCNKVCTAGECCAASTVACDTFLSCPTTTHRLRQDAATHMCTAGTCTTDECCVALDGSTPTPGGFGSGTPKPNQAAAPTDSGGGGSSVGIIVGVLLGVLLLASVAAFLLVQRRRKRMTATRGRKVNKCEWGDHDQFADLEMGGAVVDEPVEPGSKGYDYALLGDDLVVHGAAASGANGASPAPKERDEAAATPPKKAAKKGRKKPRQEKEKEKESDGSVEGVVQETLLEEADDKSALDGTLAGTVDSSSPAPTPNTAEKPAGEKKKKKRIKKKAPVAEAAETSVAVEAEDAPLD
eukprot:Rhum_TRINITY_DN16492_c0_g1::Rhum_TRINITY_DN16492_c0_g1_i1::g.163099::m.163099